MFRTLMIRLSALVYVFKHDDNIIIIGQSNASTCKSVNNIQSASSNSPLSQSSQNQNSSISSNFQITATIMNNIHIGSGSKL